MLFVLYSTNSILLMHQLQCYLSKMFEIFIFSNPQIRGMEQNYLPYHAF